MKETHRHEKRKRGEMDTTEETVSSSRLFIFVFLSLLSLRPDHKNSFHEVAAIFLFNYGTPEDIEKMEKPTTTVVEILAMLFRAHERAGYVGIPCLRTFKCPPYFFPPVFIRHIMSLS